MHVEVKVGVLHTSRELTVESELTPAEVENLVQQAVSGGSALRLEDARGSIVVVPAATLAYVEIGSTKRGGVGFGML
ncbi:MAG: DUF3107 domain-containing protein [Dermatophilus congolensis]|nr:DUF3107 domain-containing protein [Dermatophilus congolensis]